MSLYRPALCALVLLVGAPLSSGARAEGLPAHTQVRIVATPHFIDDWQGETARLLTIRKDGDAAALSCTARVVSDAGSEDVALVESDAWLHGAGKIGSLPKTEAALTLTLYDKGSASLMSFSGTLGTDGEVSLTADATGKTATSLDIEVLAGEVFGTSGAYELGLDLAGADTYAVAYAMITVTESTEVTTCDKSKTCTTTGSSSTTKSEVYWDDIGAVWQGDLTLAHEGVIEAKVRSYDAEGEELDSTKVALGVPWMDGGDGVNVMGVDEDPLTTVGLLGRRVDVMSSGEIRWVASNMTVVSFGWTSSTAPATAQLSLDNGGTITMSSAILMRFRKRPELLYQAWDSAINDYISDIVENPIYNDELTGVNPLHGLQGRINISGGSITFVDESLVNMVDSPICVSGGCFMIVDDGNGSYDLSISSYGSDAAKLPDALDLTVTVTDEAGDEVFSKSDTVEFDDDVTAVFTNEASFSKDPVGLDLSGKLSLLGAADKKGAQKTLAKGKFYGTVSRDGEGDLGLAGADKDDVSSEGSVVVAGSAVTFELTDTDKNGEVDGPPVALVTPLFGSETARVVTVRRKRGHSEAQRKEKG